MKYFIDTEFSERGHEHPIQLISIGVVREDGRCLYAESSEFDPDSCNAWVKKHVLLSLSPDKGKTRSQIRTLVKRFIGKDTKPEFWGYYADYDWVVFAQLFGSMVNLPKGWPMFCRDIKQLAMDRGNPALPEQKLEEHNALNDAFWNKEAYEFLQKASKT